MNTSTFGPAFSYEIDGARIAGQMLRVFVCMGDGYWRTLRELSANTGDPESSVSAQLRHLRKEQFGGHIVHKRRRNGAGTWEYKLVVPKSKTFPVQVVKGYMCK